MSKVRFEQEYSQSNQYSVVPHRWPHDNHTGDYYPAADVERLVEAAEEGLDSLEYVERNLPGQTGYGVRQKRIDKLKAALKPFEEV